MGKLAVVKTEPQAFVNVSLDRGDWLDVMDGEGTWNVAQVLDFPSTKEVLVRYDGWGQEYDEVVLLNSDRVAPYHTYTWSVKCWAKYKNWPWWPSVVTIRSPGTSEGQTYLENEDRLFVDFLDRNDITKRCRCWVERSKVTPFDERYDDRRKRTSGSDFERSLAIALKSAASSKFPKFTKGTLPVNFKTAIATPVKVMKKELGMQKWAGSFNSNRSRHRGVYMYQVANAGDDDDDDDDDDEVVQFAPSEDDDDTPKKARAKSKGKGQARIKSENSLLPGNVKTEKYATKLEPVAPVKDCALIVDGPHAPNIKEEVDEQPMYLPPIEEPSGAAAYHTSDDEGVRKSRTKGTSVSSNAGSSNSRKRKSPSAHSSSQTTTNKSARALGRRKSDETIGESLQGDVDSGIDFGVTSVDDDSQETFAVFEGKDNASSVPRGQELVKSNNAGEDDDNDRDLIPLDSLDDVKSPEPSTNESEVLTTPKTFHANFGVDASVDKPSYTRASIDNYSPTSAKPNDGAMDQSSGRDASACHVAIDSSTVEHVHLDKPEDSIGSSQASQTTKQESSMEVDDGKPRRVITKHSAAISPADECIAEAQSALAETVDKLAPNKKRRISGSDESVGTSTMNTVPSEKITAQKSSSHPTEPPTDGGKSALASIPTTESPPRLCDKNDIALVEDDNQGGSRRRTRSGSKGVSRSRHANSLGKTPVWVLPSPKFDPAFDVSSLRPPTLVNASALPPPFSSLSLFGSTVEFSLKSWFKRDKYPQYSTFE